MRILRSINRTLVARVTVTWAVVFAIVHAYWAAGGAAGMNGDPADTAASQGYIGFITLLGVLGAVVAHGLDPSSRSLLARRTHVVLARAGGAALLVGVVVGTTRWLVDGGLTGDGAAGVITTLFFLIGGVLFSTLGWRPSGRDKTSRQTLGCVGAAPNPRA